MDCCRSRENWTRRFVARRLLQVLTSAAARLSVLTSSVPLSALGVGCHGAGRIEEHVVGAAESRRAQTQEYRVFRRQYEVQLGEAGVAIHGGRVHPAHTVELLRRRHHQLLVASFIVRGLRDHAAGAVGELHDGGDRQEMLVKAGVEKYPVFANRFPQSAAELLTAVVRLTVGVGLLRVEETVAQVIEQAAMPVVASRGPPAFWAAIGVLRLVAALLAQDDTMWSGGNRIGVDGTGP